MLFTADLMHADVFGKMLGIERGAGRLHGQGVVYGVDQLADVARPVVVFQRFEELL